MRGEFRTGTPPKNRKPDEGMTTQTKPAVKFHVRWMILRDMPEVLEIEKDSFEFPWDEETFKKVLAKRYFGQFAHAG